MRVLGSASPRLQAAPALLSLGPGTFLWALSDVSSRCSLRQPWRLSRARRGPGSRHRRFPLVSGALTSRCESLSAGAGLSHL